GVARVDESGRAEVGGGYRVERRGVEDANGVERGLLLRPAGEAEHLLGHAELVTLWLGEGIGRRRTLHEFVGGGEGPLGLTVLGPTRRRYLVRRRFELGDGGQE